MNKSFLDDLEQASPALQVPISPPKYKELGNLTWKVFSSCCDYLIDHVTARVNPERRIEKANLFKCFLPCVPLETDPLSLCWVPGEACLGVERTVNPHHLSTASSHKECISRTKSLEYFLLPGTCTCKKCTKYQGILVILVGAFFLPKETSYGEIWCMSHWEGFWIPHISYSKNFTKSIICCLNYLSQATLSQNRK